MEKLITAGSKPGRVIFYVIAHSYIIMPAINEYQATRPLPRCHIILRCVDDHSPQPARGKLWPYHVAWQFTTGCATDGQSIDRYNTHIATTARRSPVPTSR